jgi:adenylate cyclase
MTLRLDTIRECFEGVIPATMATCGPDGVPNLSYLSQVQYVDEHHLALSYQFFNKTRRNILANPRARLTVISPVTAHQYTLTLQYVRTETAGPLFEHMKAKLAGIASHVGMAGVFHLLGSDIYRVTEIATTSVGAPRPPPQRNLLAALRACTQEAARCNDLESLFNTLLEGLDRHFGIGHAMIMMVEQAAGRLYTVASRGYAESGIGSEIALGVGVIGVAARERTPIRIGHMNAEYAYTRAIRDNLDGAGAHNEIALPGLPQSRSQMAVPMVCSGVLAGVLYVESGRDLRFGYDEEDALLTLTAHVALCMQGMLCAIELADEPAPAAATTPQKRGAPLTVRYFAENGSVFFDDDYLIKGVAGTVFWSLVSDYVETGRTAFSNRELRLDPRIRLPDLSDNLEARLILLGRRLAERDGRITIVKTGRGRFQLKVDCPLRLAAG